MKISVELTLLPLKNEFEPPISDFIKALRTSEFKVIENPLSTQIYSDYTALMSFLNTTIKSSFENLDQVVLQMKIVKTDRSNYESDF